MIWTLILSFGLASARQREYVSPEHLNHLRATGQDEEFARLLAVDPKFVRADSERRSEGSMFNQVSRWGDILVPERDEEERQSINFEEWEEWKWPDQRIPVVISKEFSEESVWSIISAILNWNEIVDNLKIVPRNNETSYVFIFPGSGCWSYLGRIRGQQPLSLQEYGCINRGTIQHEVEHAAGFAHEHCRGDRDKYVEVLWCNIPEDWKSQYEKVDGSAFLNIGRYDFDSVMHYPNRAPGSTIPAFRVLQDGVDDNSLGQRDGLSEGDVNKINTAYKEH